MARERFQIVLNVSGCSGRGVRYQRLLPSERDAVFTVAAQTVGAKATPQEMRMAEFREALHKMLIGVTKEVGFKDMAAIQAGGDKVTWVTLTPEKLQTDPACSVDALFNGKDENILISIYRRDNEVTVEELEAVAGKALPLLAD